MSICVTHFTQEHIQPRNLQFNMRAHPKLGAIPSIGVPNPIESTVKTMIEASPAINVPSPVVEYVIGDNVISNENLDTINYIHNKLFVLPLRNKKINSYFFILNSHLLPDTKAYIEKY